MATLPPKFPQNRDNSLSPTTFPVLHLLCEFAAPNHALQRTPGFGVQLPSAAVVRPAQSRAVLPARVKGLRPHAAGAPAQPAPSPCAAVLTAAPPARSR